MPLAPTLCPLSTVPLSEKKWGYTEQHGEWEEAPGHPQSLSGLDMGSLGTLWLN